MSITQVDPHDTAMNLAEDALLARRRGEEAAAIELFRQAYLREREAVEQIDSTDAVEPTRSIVLRSAASLALQANELREAERLVARGLSGNPPEEIADELRALLEQVHQRSAKT